jgi:hypothetical protein
MVTCTVVVSSAGAVRFITRRLIDHDAIMLAQLLQSVS